MLDRSRIVLPKTTSPSSTNGFRFWKTTCLGLERAGKAVEHTIQREGVDAGQAELEPLEMFALTTFGE
jgi:hypothetical protein